MTSDNLARIRSRLRHPILDGDCHWIEPRPVFLDQLREVAGSKIADDFVRITRGESWYTASPEERMSKRIRRLMHWGGIPGLSSSALDQATCRLPALMRERLDEIGIDFAIIYPTIGLPFNNIAPAEVRRAAIRAYNTMASDLYAPHRAVFAPVAMVPTHTPQEAIDEATHAVETLGMKAIMIRGTIPRPIDAYADRPFETTFERDSRRVPFYIDTLGLDNPYDYDPFWAKCVELGVAVTAHGGSHEWPDRKSVNSYVFNHVGHFAQSHHAFAKALFLGGVTRRFPSLSFAFQEGGVGYAVCLLHDLLGHWTKLNISAQKANLSLDRLDLAKLRQLVVRYGSAREKDAVDDILRDIVSSAEGDPIDDFAAAAIDSEQALISLFTRNFYFGCEADDAATTWAFDPRAGARFNATFGSDISHFDVPDPLQVVPEAYEMVERRLISEPDFEAFCFGNTVRLHGRANPNFFAGTSIEGAAADVLGRVATESRT